MGILSESSAHYYDALLTCGGAGARVTQQRDMAAERGHVKPGSEKGMGRGAGGAPKPQRTEL